MISRALVIRYTGEVTVKYSARCFRVALPLNAAIVPGTMMSDWAKMMGITFAVLSRSGMNVSARTMIRFRHISLRVVLAVMGRVVMGTVAVTVAASAMTAST